LRDNDYKHFFREALVYQLEPLTPIILWLAARRRRHNDVGARLYY